MVNYDPIASFYDLLKNFVFGRRLEIAESTYLHKIGSGDKVLIIGGGTGICLDKIPLNAEITFVELSSKMIDLAKGRRDQNTRFVNVDFLEFCDDKKYDWILTPFFLDVFEVDMLETVIARIKTFTKSNSKLIVTDFENNNWWQKGFTKLMYFFFRLTTGMRPCYLLDFNYFLNKNGFFLHEESFFMKDYIFSRIYRQQSNLK